MRHLKKIKLGIGLEVLFVVIFAVYCIIGNKQEKSANSISVNSEGFIKWVDFNVSYEALSKAYELDVASFESDNHYSWIELLAYIAAKNGGTFSKTAEKELGQLADTLTQKKVTVEELAKDMKYYPYYLEAYEAILGGFVGEYEQQTSGEAENAVYEKRYGLKAYSPIARGFPYNDYDDFGSSRSYGFKREHLGHDMMGQVGMPTRMISRTTSRTYTLKNNA